MLFIPESTSWQCIGIVLQMPLYISRFMLRHRKGSKLIDVGDGGAYGQKSPVDEM